MDWSRPSTPHRRSTSVASNGTGHFDVDPAALPLDAVLGQRAIEELSDGLASLDMNMQHLRAIHHSVTSFNESFASLLHSMKMNAWCVEFPEAPTSSSFQHDRSEWDLDGKENKENEVPDQEQPEDYDNTYMTDESFIELPSPGPRPQRPAHSAGRVPISGTTPRGTASSIRSTTAAKPGTRNTATIRSIGGVSGVNGATAPSRGSRIPQPARAVNGRIEQTPTGRIATPGQTLLTTGRPGVRTALRNPRYQS